VKDHLLTRVPLWPRSVVETAIYVFFQLSFLHFMLSKQGKKFGCNSFQDYLKLLGVRKFAWSTMGSYLIVYHIGLFIGMLCLQYSEGEFYYTTNNFFSAKDGIFSIRWFVTIWILTPIREEVYFRGCVFTTALHRSRFLSIPILLTGLVFGGAHLLNLFSPNVSTLYVLLQFVSAVIVGVFYCLRFLVTGTLWESIVLHFINNATSSFLPTGPDFDFSNPKIGLPMTCTLMLYSIMAYFSLEQLKKHPIWGECFKEKLEDVSHPFERLTDVNPDVILHGGEENEVTEEKETENETVVG